MVAANIMHQMWTFENVDGGLGEKDVESILVKISKQVETDGLFFLPAQEIVLFL